jgi:predicted dehydrogenase
MNAGSRPRYRAAIIGTGRIASLLERDPLRGKPHTHAGWYRSHPQIELVAGADIDPGRLQAFGKDWDIADTRLFPDYRDMLSRMKPDLVSICAYAPQRLEMVTAAIEAGVRGLWIEKAIACSLLEARALQELVSRSDVRAIVDHPRRAASNYRAVRRIIVDHTLGDLLTVTCMMSGDLIHTGTHAYDMLDYWCGDMTGAIGALEEPIPAGGPIRDCGGNGHLFFDSGIQAFIEGRSREYYIFQFDLAFTRGRIMIGNDVQKVLLPGPSGRYTGFVELFDAPGFDLSDPYPWPMVHDLIHSLETGAEPVMSLANALKAFRMGLALFQSHREGHRLIHPQDLDETLRIESV